MHAVVISNGQMQETTYLREISKQKIAKMTEEQWHIHGDFSVEEFCEFIEQQGDMEVVYLDVVREHALQAAETMRQKNKDAILLLIADETQSPMKYLKPSIQASALLLRPIDKKEAKSVVEETWDLYASMQAQQEQFEISPGRKLPMEGILFFESCHKRIYAHLSWEKIGFDETLENLALRLPSYFARCHRGIIVNTRKIKNIVLSQGEICLQNNVTVPFSRTYKETVKEWKNKYGV